MQRHGSFDTAIALVSLGLIVISGAVCTVLIICGWMAK